MMTRYALLIFVLLWSVHMHGQREAARWYFGKEAGLDFNNGDPVVLTDGVLDTTEGCASISDKEFGNLKFYTEGENIYKRNHILMDNGEGLLGSISSSQSAVIVPRPGSNTLYYVFTADVVQAYQTNGVGNGINYAVVDMEMSGGFGFVTEKNVPLLANGSEKLSAVRAANGIDYWLVTHKENRFYAYEITAAGINTTPVISTIGPTIDTFENYRGSLKLSPDGSKLGIAHCFFEPSFSGRAILYDFDNDTGQVSNEIVLSSSLVYYGVEFSPNSQRIYFSSKNLDAQGFTDDIIVEQFDVAAANPVATRYQLISYNNDLLSDLAGGLQLALDGNIYHAQPGSALSFISNPNGLQNEVSYNLLAQPLATGISSFGLPQTVSSFLENFVTIENFCEGDTTTFTVDPIAQVSGASWDFGDPASGGANTSIQINPSHVFTEAGDYTITVTFDFFNRGPKTYVLFVTIIPSLNLPATIFFSQCDLDTLDDGISTFNLNAIMDDAITGNGLQDLDYTFFFSEADALANVNAIPNSFSFTNSENNQVIYATIEQNTECNDIIPITLNVVLGSNPPDIEYDICDIFMSRDDIYQALLTLGDTILSDYPSSSIAFYYTEENAVRQINAINQATVPPNLEGFEGVHYRISSGTTCIAIGYVDFNIIDVTFQDNIFLDFCPSQSTIELSMEQTFSGYEWSTGETTPTIVVDEGGEYDLVVTNAGGCSDDVRFIVTEIPALNIEVRVNDFSQNNQIVVDVLSPLDDLLFSIDGLFFQESNVFNNVTPGIKLVEVKDQIGCNQAITTVRVEGGPSYFTPNGDGTNDTWHLYDATRYNNLKLEIYDRFGKRLHTLGQFTRGWDGTYNGEEMPMTSYWYRGELADGKTFAGHFLLKR